MKTSSAAELLRELRERQGGSLRAVADEAGLAPSQLSRMERGERPLTEDAAEKLSKYYDVSGELMNLARGILPRDVLEILQKNPHELDRLRRKYR